MNHENNFTNFMNIKNNLYDIGEHKEHIFRKTLLVRKVELDSESYYKKEIDEAFNDPNKYLEINEDKMVVGKFCKFPKIDKDSKIKSYKYIGSPQMFYKRDGGLKESKSSVISHKSTLDVNRTYLNNNKKSEKNVDLVSERGLNDIYNKFTKIKTRNIVKINDFMEDIDPRGKQELKKILLLQEKCLKDKEKFNQTTKRLSQMIMTKTKKNEDEILMNRTDGLRIKKEINKMVEDSKCPSEKFGRNNWLVSLRRPDNFEGTRFSYVNVGTNYNPTWTMVKEEMIPNTMKVDSIRQPESKSGQDLIRFTKNDFMSRTLSNFNFSVKENLEKFNNLTVIIIFLYILDKRKRSYSK